MSKTQEAVTQRKFYLEKIMTLKAFTDDADKLNSSTIFELQAKLERLKNSFDNFEVKCMLLKCADASIDNANEDAKIEASFIGICEKIHNRIEALKKQQSLQSVNSEFGKECVQSVKSSVSSENKPSIINTWREFDGELDNWYEFCEEFEKSVILNEAIDNNAKFDLLKDACKNKAKSMVDEVNDCDKAWNKLKRIYEDAYTQLHHVIFKLTQLPCVDASYDQIQLLLKTGNESVNCLSKCLEKDKYESVMVILLASKLDAETSHAWDRHRMVLASSLKTEDQSASLCNASSYIPEWDAMRDFLESEKEIHIQAEFRMRSKVNYAQLSSKPCTSQQSKQSSSEQCVQYKAYEQVNQAEKQNVGQNNLHKPTSAVMPMNMLIQEKKNSPEFLRCVLCEFIHPLFKCTSFKQMDYHQRRDHIAQHNLCIKCLRKMHPGQCEDQRCGERCPTCFAKNKVTAFHNSMLCPVKCNVPQTTQQPTQQDDNSW